MSDHAGRPPVLAHERFQADRANFSGLDLAARFDRIHRTNLWGAPTSVSGLGSESGATEALAAALPALLERLGVRTLLDAPCGDAGWITRIGHGIDYIGVDIVPALVEANIERVRRGEITGTFHVADMTRDTLPSANAVLCRDCLVHLSFANIGLAVARLRATGATWLLATTFPDWQTNTDCEDGDWRALNMQRAPFLWPRPIELINEQCAEGDGGWRDKSLGLWRFSELPPPARQVLAANST